MVISASFIVGAGIGAASTYLYKDPEAREKVIAAGKKLKNQASDLICSLRNKNSTENIEQTKEAQPATAATPAT